MHFAGRASHNVQQLLSHWQPDQLNFPSSGPEVAPSLLLVDTSTACQASIELIGEVKRDGLSTTYVKNVVKNYSLQKIMVTRKDGTLWSTHESNVTAVMGQMATGGGFSNLEQSLSIFGIPPLSKPVLIDTDSERCLDHHLFEHYLSELMLEAGREEKQIAIDNKRDHQGKPTITVIVNAGWSK